MFDDRINAEVKKIFKLNERAAILWAGLAGREDGMCFKREKQINMNNSY